MNDINVCVYRNVLDGGIASAEKDSPLGFVYAVEYGCMIKIGCTKNPRNRLMHLRSVAEKYGGISLGRVCLIGPIYKFYKAECIIHKAFSESRKAGTELFDIPFDFFVEQSSSFDIMFEFNQEEWGLRSRSSLESLKKLLGYENVENESDYVLSILERKLEEERELIRKFESRNAELLYKARYVDDMLTSKDTLSMDTVALILNFGFGRNKLYKILRDENILSSQNIPNVDYLNNGWFSLNGKTVGVYQTGVFGMFLLLKEKYGLVPKIVA
jgi:phage antirepressor YoqD-like protein